ncbi:MAG: type II secretion system protein GspG [Deltaproteobacteria bacterium]|nr:type II secretion system protein GspG [Deltaproteobacteria bacterium]MBN2673461.1 type II secretion system protein GspG [Deltaproteobacteria bacterium]
MFGRKEFVLGKKGHRRKKLGPLARRIRAISVVTLIVLFMGWSIGFMSNRRRVRQAQLDISRIAHAARLFRADFGRCPAGVEELSAPPEGTPYLRAMKDPWGKPYILQCPAFQDSEDVDVVSLGPDGEESGEDDVKSYIAQLNLWKQGEK